MRKKILSLALALVMCLSPLPTAALAYSPGAAFTAQGIGSGGNGSAQLRGCRDTTSTDITIPDTMIVEHPIYTAQKVEWQSRGQHHVHLRHPAHPH